MRKILDLLFKKSHCGNFPNLISKFLKFVIMGKSFVDILDAI